MSVTRLGDQLASASGTFEERVKQKRLLEQMISCIDFIMEKVSSMNSKDPILDELQTLAEAFDLRHEQIVSHMVANDTGVRATKFQYYVVSH